jgi:hypothetical protein
MLVDTSKHRAEALVDQIKAVLNEASAEETPG